MYVCIYIYIYTHTHTHIHTHTHTHTHIYIYIYMKIYCTEIRCSTRGITELFLQAIYNIITLCFHVGESKAY